MIKAVVFDLDDTLISEMDYVRSGYQHISQIISDKYLKKQSEVYDLLIKLFNESSKNVFNRLLDNMDISYSESDVKKLVEEYRNHFPDIDFFEDVVPCLNMLKSHGIKTGIITDGYASGQRKKLSAISADAYFDEIIVTDEIGRDYWKPHPRAFELLVRKYDICFNEMVYVGDNPAKDFFISSIYPLKTIRIYRNNGMHVNKSYLYNIKESESIFTLKELNIQM
ncbi:HAD-IA family hydrolase [Pontibacillus sp. ALD_SL1]|uniref:HAD family hydrolase n=1 Tax=Pontibacillus sp. ALD_SL1 TaxID=2777185 RepID=UPI001A975B94|nr:HAD-IA family hydrolase [Pontibacillus sp. ALD_SL1]QSS99783.1 HAD-IA family hydrolase [Pontibacillus sp. ALD_SL1]